MPSRKQPSIAEQIDARKRKLTGKSMAGDLYREATRTPSHTTEAGSVERGSIDPIRSEVAKRSVVEPASTEAPAIEPTSVDQLAGLRIVAGYLAVPNTIVDSLWEVLDAAEAKVYLRLFRLSHGHGNATCRVGYETLGRGCKLTGRAVQTIVARLETLGLVRRLDEGGRVGTRMVKGNLYFVRVPGATEAGSVERPSREARSASKESSKESLKAVVRETGAPSLDVYGIRKIAARIRESRRGDYPREELRDAVRLALIAQGVDPDEGLIAEAMGPAKSD